MDANKDRFNAIERIKPFLAEFIRQYDFITNEIDPGPGYGCNGPGVSFQQCKANGPEIEAHKIAFVAVEEKPLGIVVKPIWQHRKSDIDSCNAIGPRQLILERAMLVLPDDVVPLRKITLIAYLSS